MTDRHPDLIVRAAPFLAPERSTPSIMMDVLLALVPVFLAAVWYFGLSAILLVGAATAGAVATEWCLTALRPRTHALKDNSAVLTGVLLGLTLPPGLPMWMAFVGGFVSIGLGKMVWGGLGQNLFNPALVGRAFLQAAFPTALTTWVASGTLGDALALRASNFALPLMQAPPLPADVDVLSAATPLAMMKFQHEAPPLLDLLVGNTGGSLGETSAAIILLCGLWLVSRRAFDWRIPTSILVTVAVVSAAFHLASPDRFPAPWHMLLSGGLLFGTVYMATDPVTSPLAPRGAWVFGAGIGFLVVIIRLFGGLPEGVMYAILLMNAASPLIDRALQPRAFGRVKPKGGGSP